MTTAAMLAPFRWTGGAAMTLGSAVRRMRWLAPRNLACRWLAAVLLVLIGAGAGTDIVVHRITALPAGAALRVNGTVVTEEMLRHRIDLLGALYGVQAPPDGPQLDQFRRDAAKSVAVSMILDKAAHDRGIVIADKAAQDDLNMVIQQGFPDGRDAFLRALSAKGASEQDVLDELKRQLAGTQLFTDVTKSVPTVTDADVSTAIARHVPETFTPEKRHLRNIVVGSEQEANQVLAQLRSGADFGALAGQLSLDQSTKSSSGDLGTVSADQLDGDYSKVAFGAPQGALVGPVHTRFGWNIGQILQISPSQQLPADQVKTALDNEHKLNTWRDWLADTIRNAHVQYADTYRPANPDAAPPTTP